MNYQIKKHAKERAYMQLFLFLRADILSGVLPRGTKLLSKRAMAEELGISVITVEHAYDLLSDEGYIEPRSRSGFYVCFGTPAFSEPPKRAALEEMQASDSAPKDFPFSVLAKTMRRVLSEYDRRILNRCPNCGCPELRNAISAWLGRTRGLNIDPEQIIIGSGAEYLYGLVVQLLGRERSFALEDPSYIKIRQTYELHGARCEMLPMGPDGILSSSLLQCKAGVLHVTPFHSYPSGVTASAAKRREYLLWAQANNATIVEDDYDAEFAAVTRQVETIFSLSEHHVIYLNTFTKLLAPSIRTGFMVLPPVLREQYEKKLGMISCTVPVYEQLVLASFINEGHLERYVNQQKRTLRQKK